MAHVLANELRESIYVAAISGKLTKQNIEDRSALDLLKDLRNKKEELVKDKKIYKKKNTDPLYTSEQLGELNIPNNWCFAQLSDVSLIQEGAGIRNWQYRDSGIQLLCVTNILEGQVDLNKKHLYISRDEYEEKYKHLTVNKGDIVSSCSGGSWGKTSLYIHDDVIMMNTSTLRLRFFGDLANNSYLYMLTKSNWFKKQLQDQLSGMQPNFGYAHYSRIMIPLPPIEEQARIVARVDELMAMIDEYEKLENQLVELKRDFPGDMKDAILQVAMQGKLTEQLATDSHIAIKADEINSCYDLIEIPENWQWNTIDSVIDVSTGLTFSKEDQRSAGNNTLRIMRGGNILDNYSYSLFDNDVYVSYRDKYIPLEIGDVLSPAVTSMEKMCKVAYIDKPLENTTAGGFVYILRSKNNEILNPKYMMYFFSSNFNRSNCNENIHKSGQAFYNLKKSGMVTQPIPIPPIEEQNRIVEKLEELLPLCDSLKQ